MGEAPDPVRGRQLVRHREPKKAGFPAQGGPLVTDGTMHLMRTCPRGPVDRATFKVPELPGAVRGPQRGGCRLPEKALRAAQSSIFFLDRRRFQWVLGKGRDHAATRQL